jgi:hypothetical protein
LAFAHPTIFVHTRSDDAVPNPIGFSLVSI